MTDSKKEPVYHLEEVYGTLYPYFNSNKGFVTQSLTKIRRAMAPINPFAIQQIATQKREAFGIKFGSRPHFVTPYPNGIVFEKGLSMHYDPLSSTRYDVDPNFVHGPQGKLRLVWDPMPKACHRTITKFKMCEMVNGGEQCKDEEKNILEICPDFALDSIYNMNRFKQKVEAIHAQTYHKAMEVSDYNKGRSLKNVSGKSFIHGTRKYLRPDTLYADERYKNITQEEINEAKARVAEREAKKATYDSHSSHNKHDEHHDNSHHKLSNPYVPIKGNKPLYPQVNI